MKSRAAVLDGQQSMTVRYFDVPVLQNDEVLIDVEACGICGSNIHQWMRAPRERGDQQPGANGHEYAGVVRSVGAVGSHLSVGKRVVVDPAASTACGSCSPCSAGAHWFCSQRRMLPLFGFADCAVVPRHALYAVPQGMTADVAALTEPTACGVHAVRHSWTAGATGIEGVHVLVIGAGMLGLAAAMAARYFGASRVSIVARYPHQVDAARDLRVDRAYLDSEPDLAEALRRGRPSLVIEAVGGSGQTLQMAEHVVAWRGEVVVLGHFPQHQLIDAARALSRETRFFFSIGYAAKEGIHDFSIALDLLAQGGPSVAKLVTSRLPLEQVQEAFIAASDKTRGSIRVMVGGGERGAGGDS